MDKIRVVHLTAHFGGGVGRVLSKVAINRKETDSQYEDVFVCTRKPEKMEPYYESMIEAGIEIHVEPRNEEFIELINNADIVQLEWWHHPLICQWLCQNKFNARLMIWGHVSGLYCPTFPKRLLAIPHTFVFTSPVSLVRFYSFPGKHNVINSSGGFDDIVFVDREKKSDNLSYGYLGSFSFSKLHPNISDFVEAIDYPGFKMKFYGYSPMIELEQAVKQKGVEDKVELCGYTTDVGKVLKDIDILIHLLNPEHFGTNENALLEAMAAGAVPIVLSNDAETFIVRHRVNGLVVHSLKSLNEAIYELNKNKELRLKLSKNARDTVRSLFPIKSTVAKLDWQYKSLLRQDKKDFDFSEIFGNSPYEWWRSCMGEYINLFNSGVSARERLKHFIFYEKSKSSAFHYNTCFPEDKRLTNIVSLLREDLKNGMPNLP